MQFGVERDGTKMRLVIGKVVSAAITAEEADHLARQLVDASYDVRRARRAEDADDESKYHLG